MEGDVEGVRIIPPCVEFKDIDAQDQPLRVNITVKNVSKTSKEIRYWGPQNKVFQLKVNNPDKPIAPGLEVPAVIEFAALEATEYKDRVVVTVDGKVIEVPLHAIPCRPILSLEGPIKFGSVVANSKVIAREAVIYNHGSKEGEFKLKYSGDKPITVIPSTGKVPPQSSQVVKIEYVTKSAGKFDEQIRVRLEGRDPACLRVVGRVQNGGLQLLDPDTTDTIWRVGFGSAYYGTDKTASALLYNNSPEPVSFVAVLDEGAVGQELGTDLSKSTAAAIASQDAPDTGEMNPLTSLVTVLPNQGILAPYERVPVFFRFSPRWRGSSQGFSCSEEPPPRKDFALFLHLKVIGASQGFTNEDSAQDNKAGASSLEVALTATALPVLLSLAPQSRFDFGECPVGHHVDTLCTLTNESCSVPVNYKFRRIAHFIAKPAAGKIRPGESQDVVFSFAPNQVGTFSPQQYVDILGHVADNQNPFLLRLQVIHSSPIALLGASSPVTVHKQPVFNPGVTPKITNEVGLYVDTTVAEPKNSPWSAVLNSSGTKLHHTSKGGSKGDKKTLIAFPNDRAQSIRPSDRNVSFKTPFTRTERHTYVDPDYAYTDGEKASLDTHRGRYTGYIDQLRDKRRVNKQAKEFAETNNPTDIALKPAAGIAPKQLLLSDVRPDPKPPTPPNKAFRMPSVKDLANKEAQSTTKTCDGLNAIPTSTQEKTDCRKVLSPQQLHQIVIGPATIDFGSVCLKSVSQKELTIVNNLNQYIHIVVNVDCRELRQTSPLSQVVPPCSKAVLPIIFECSSKGRFQRSLDYTINGFYKHHVTVFAEVVPVALELSCDQLVLEAQGGMPADAGIRGVITLKNKLNYPAEFTWSPILGERGTAFSVRPATGVVEALTDLDCEVVFHPSFLAPEDGEFALSVHGGKTLKLSCLAKLGATNVTFVDRRIMFGQVPLHLTTTRTVMLKNNSLNHAYYQVLDPNPFPGLTVTPLHGIVPVGGTTDLKVHLTPNAIIKFDTRVNISIRGWKTLELRMGGTVEPPCLDIDLPNFNIGGVFCGSSLSMPFKLVNKAHTQVRVEFNLSRYTDFTLDFPNRQTPEDLSFQLMNPGLYTVTVDGDETIKCLLVFKPTEVASYDFIIPVTINQTSAPTPSSTPFPPTPAPTKPPNSLSHIINPRPVTVHIVTPRRKVIATALRQPLELSHHRLEFDQSPRDRELGAMAGVGQTQQTMLVNNSDKPIHWLVDLARANKAMEAGVFKFLHPSGMPFLSHGDRGVEGDLEPGQTFALGVLFCADKPGLYEATLPVILNEDFGRPYQSISLVGSLSAPQVWFDPLAVVLTPVPLLMEIGAEFQVFATNYMKRSSLRVELPEVECDDGSQLCPLSVTFLDGNDIAPCCDGDAEPVTLLCRVTFKSPRPMSFNQPLVFVDDMDNKFLLPVTATADNCLMTCYPFVAQHRNDHQIVCEQGLSLRGRQTASRESINAGEAVLVPCDSPHRSGSQPSTTATSSNFDVSSSSFEDSNQSLSDSTFRGTPREGAVNKITSDSDGRASHGRTDLQSRSLGSALFPDDHTEEGIFHSEVLVAVQRWFSSQGWPGGPNPISVPESLRNGISKKPDEEKVKNSKGGSFESNNLKKEFRTVYDMVSHLSGKTLPGIPINGSLPKDKTERAKQVYWQHSTLLTFLKTQGACVASIKPEYLMAPADYQAWVALRRTTAAAASRDSGHRDSPLGPGVGEDDQIQDQLYEAVSKRAWTDVLLQILKTLYLSKISPRQFKNLPSPYKSASMPSIDPDPLCSNVYSIPERIVLLWLNHHYEQQRRHIWAGCQKGGVPPSRWVVNFDFDLLDGLVLAAVLGAHVPFLVTSHLADMYTHPATAEQCLHNALKVVNAMRMIGIDYDIQAIDITDPNPISLMLLCIHFYFNLPQYIPKTTVDFVGALHTTVLRQVKLSNPSAKPLIYHALLAGPDAGDFSLPRGDTITVTPKSSLNLSVEFSSRFLRPADAVLVLVGRRQGAAVGSTLVFTLRTQIDNIVPKTTIKVESPVYELNKLSLEVTNPFPRSGEFKVVLLEVRVPESGSLSATSSTNSLLGVSSTASVNRRRRAKKVKSKINTGIRPVTLEEEARVEKSAPGLIPSAPKHDDDDGGLLAFHAPCPVVALSADSPTPVTLHFLPFHLGHTQCSVVFMCPTAGEFVYVIDAVATLPAPLCLPFSPAGQKTARIGSAAAAGSSDTSLAGKVNTIYWKCESNRQLEETINVPLANSAKDQALMAVAQQGMSEKELARRQITGTLTSGTLTATALQTLSKGGKTLCKPPEPEEISFSVEVDSKFFSVPSTISTPNPNYKSPLGATTKTAKPAGTSSAGVLGLPVRFLAAEPGVYPCRVTLQSPDDIRVYHIECGVTPEGSQADIEYRTPVHKAVTQEIPVVNQTNHDWLMAADIEGACFSGPGTLKAKAYQTTTYPLVFRPEYEGVEEGKLVLSNKDDNIEHTFKLTGTGEKPLPLEHIVIEAEVKQSVSRFLRIPNVTKKKLYYKVETDLPYVSGEEFVSVLPTKEDHYEVKVDPLRRGHHKGVIMFVAGPNPLSDLEEGREIDSDGEDDASTSSDTRGSYRVWFSAELIVKPSAAEKTLNIQCPCQKQAILEVGVNNPTSRELTMEVCVSGEGLCGPSEVTLPPHAKYTYELTYSPTVIGEYTGSLVFYHPSVGEFWYSLSLTASHPEPTRLAPIECELGRWARTHIRLQNHTAEPLSLVPTVSNTNNFSLDRDDDRPLELGPHGSLSVPLVFMPSTLGHGDHRATVAFHCPQKPQLGEWVFHASGSGILPQTQDPVSITSAVGNNSTLIIPFRNPLDLPVLVRVTLKDADTEDHRSLSPVVSPPASPFSLLLRQTDSSPLRLGPKSRLDVPLSYAPALMDMSRAEVTVTVTREDGEGWMVSPSMELKAPERGFSAWDVSSLVWTFPVRGYPELGGGPQEPAVVACQARGRVEERIEVVLSGAAPSAGGPKRGASALKGAHTRAVTPKDERPNIPDGVVVAEGLSPADEFTFQLEYPAPAACAQLEPAVALQLVRHQRDRQSGLVTLVFNVVYAPYTAMSHAVELVVQGATGGLWRFPLRFSASEPEPDDTILLEAAGLDRESSVGFRLHSQSSQPTPYKAYFLAGADPELVVTPASGELLPPGTPGTLLKVAFTPAKYGKIYQGKLVVQSPSMQWTYHVRGVVPDYSPPRGHSSHPMAGPHPDPRRRTHRPNYVRENLKLTTTAVSSPVKGAPVIPRNPPVNRLVLG